VVDLIKDVLVEVLSEVGQSVYEDSSSCEKGVPLIERHHLHLYSDFPLFVRVVYLQQV
jgi:hypothetical protein